VVESAEQWKGLPSGSLVILQATVGSTVCGTSVSDVADRDEMAICIEPPAKVVGLQHFETMVYRTQPDGVRSGPGDLDLTVHTLRKFSRLAAKGNPTILLPLYAPSSALIGKTHYFGHALRDRRAMFLSKQVGKAFLGYLIAQKERLTGERGQMRVTRTELVDAHGFDTKYAGHVIRLALQGIEIMTTGHMTLPMRKAEAQEVLDVRTGKLTLQQALTRAGELERELRDSLDTGLLPDHPDAEAIDKFVVSVYLDTWRPSLQESADDV
jgi:predicted nucleotidyltransferase